MVRKKLEFGLDRPSGLGLSEIGSKAHLALARDVAVNGSVLLKNDGGVLPLSASAHPQIVVAGALADMPNTGDSGSSSTRPAFVVSALQGIEELFGDLVAIDHIDKDVLGPADLARVQAADAVIVVTGLTAADEGEGLIGAGDRLDLGLSAQRSQLIRDAAAVNDRTIVVLEGGGAITMGDWLADVEALLMVWYPGQMGGYAIADLLFGEVNPSGKLPITFPASLEQLPSFDNESLEVTYQYFHGYRFVDRNGSTPEFPFGFGLSYTSFTIERLRASQVQAGAGDVVRFRLDVKNTGTRTGAEVIQLYVNYPDSVVPRAERELKGFARVLLEPGETQTVEIPLAVNSLAYYDVTQGAWVLEGLRHEVRLGTSSRDLPLSIRLSVAAQQDVAVQ